MEFRYILGTTSIWRQQIAKTQLGIPTTLMPADIDEKAAALNKPDPGPISHTSTIAKAKLDFLLPQVNEPNTILMCFDTVVYTDKILEKPKDMEECRQMVRSWAKKDSIVQIYTAAAIALNEPRIIKTSCERADIIMTRNLNEDEIDPYIEASGALKSSGSVIVEELLKLNACVIKGDQTVIEGLPVTCVKGLIDDIKSSLK